MVPNHCEYVYDGVQNMTYSMINLMVMMTDDMDITANVNFKQRVENYDTSDIGGDVNYWFKDAVSALVLNDFGR